MPLDQATQPQIDTGEVLRAAGHAHLYWICLTDDAKGLAQELCELTEAQEISEGILRRPRNRAASETFEQSLATWVAALIRHSQHEESLGYLYCLSGQKHLKDTCMTDRNFRAINKTWGALGLQEVQKGFQQTDDFEGSQHNVRRWGARYRATPNLIKIAAKHGITFETLSYHFGTAHEKFKPIRLRARKTGEGSKEEKGNIMAYTDSNMSQAICDDVRQLNRFLEEQDFGGIPQPLFRRVFNNGDDPDFLWNKGGRLYALGPDNYQQIKPDERARITINGEPTVELDVRASHLTIIYGLLQCDLDVEQDPYAIGNLDRWLAKKCIVALIGQGRRLERWPNNTKADFIEATRKPFPNISAKECCDIVLERHPCLSRLQSAELDWSKVQNVEAEALLDVMNELRCSENVASLPIHDSLIVPSDAKKLTEELMQKAFEDRCGIAPKIKAK